MKSMFTSIAVRLSLLQSHLCLFSVLLLIMLTTVSGYSQTNSYLGLNGGFEGAATIVNGSTNATPVATNWTKSSTNTSIFNSTSTVRSGANSMRISPTSSSICRVFSPLVTIASSSTAWQVQYYRRTNDPFFTVENQSGNYRGGVEQSSGFYSSPVSMNTWQKVTYSPTSTTAVTSAAAHLVVRLNNIIQEDIYVDDFVIYESATIDNTAPNSATAVTVGSATASNLTVGWTAAAGGVDGGGYMVVRYSTNPNTDNDPNINGVYAVGNSYINGTGSLSGIVRYVGTGTSFIDTGLTAGVTYYYKVYTYDKAYNYAVEATQSGTTVLPSVANFTPTNGCSGTSIVIIGINFDGATTVLFGGTPAASFVVNSSTQITAIVGTGISGPVSVTAGGVTSSLPGFTTLPPRAPTIAAGGASSFCAGNSVVLTAAVPSSVTDLSYSATSLIATSGTDLWQSFVPTVLGTTSAIQIYFNGLQTVTGEFNIYNGVGVGGTLIHSQNITISGLPGLNKINLPNLNLLPGNNYTFRWLGANLNLIANNFAYGSFSKNGAIQSGVSLDLRTTVAPTVGSFQWYNNGSTIGGATNATYTASIAGAYTCVNAVSGCNSDASNSSAITVNSLPPAPTISAGGPITFCIGGNVVLTSSAGSSYLWSTGATTQSITVSAAGVYTVRVTNANGCQSAASIGTTVTVNPLPTTPTISAGGPTTFCSGGSVILTSSVGTSYLWSTGATTQSITVLTAGSYTVRVTNSNGCQSAASTAVVVNINALPATPTLTADGPTTFCAGLSVVLTSSTANSYLWSTGATSQSIVITESGSYTVRVTNANGCQSAVSAPTVFTVNSLAPRPVITASGPTTFCQGGSVVLTSSPGNSYLWSTGATTQSITVSTSGGYNVSVRDAITGCLSPLSTVVFVTVNSPPAAPKIIAAGPTTFCQGGSVELISTTGSSYLWSTGATTQFITVSAAGNYTVRITNANGCQSAASTAVVVNVNALPATPTLSANGPTTFCSGGSVLLSSSAATSYLWSTGATSQSIIISESGSYTVRVTNANGCQSAVSASTVFTVNPPAPTPEITASGPTTFCQGGSVVLTSSPGNSYIWTTGATTQSITVSASGDYRVSVRDASTGCLSLFSPEIFVTVNLPPRPRIIAMGPTTFCQGENVVLVTNSASSYLWSTGATTQFITVSAAGNYTVLTTDANGCQSAASPATVVTVNAIPATPTISAGGPTTFCSGGDVILTSSPGTNYLWSTGATSQSISVSETGSYTVRVINSGCQSEASAVTSVIVNPVPIAPTITASSSTIICSGGNVTLTGSAGSSYLWSNGASTQSITVGAADNYTVQVTNVFGCLSPVSAPTAVVVNTPPATIPTITASGATTFCSDRNVTLTSSPGASYLWSTGETTQSIVVATSGNYRVQHTSNGCAGTASSPVLVNVRPSCPSIAILKLYIEGYFDTATNSMRSVRNNQDGVSPITAVDNLIVELHNSQNYRTVAITTGQLYTDGTLIVYFNNIVYGSYYIAIKGSNMVQTWSAMPQVLGSTQLTYDFTTDSFKAYGNNMKEVVSGVWAFYSGDIDQNGNIDPLDYNVWEVDYNEFASGIFVTDLDGNGNVDPLDYNIWEVNYNNFVSSFYPIAP